MSWDIFHNKFPKKFDVMIIGHRGARYEAFENTLRAFELAVDAGADMIEFDVHKTIDNHVVIIHDRTTEKISDVNIDIHTSTLEQIREVPLKDGLQIPTLEEVFAQFKGKLYFQIEIKHDGMAPDVIRLIDKYDVLDQCLISSSAHSLIPIYKSSKKKLTTASIVLVKKRKIDKTVKLGLDGIHPKYEFVDPEYVSYAHSKNLFVNPWTPDTPEDWNYMIECGVDGIITNYPRELYKFLKSR